MKKLLRKLLCLQLALLLLLPVTVPVPAAGSALVCRGGGARTPDGREELSYAAAADGSVEIPGPEDFLTPDGACFLGWKDGNGQWYLPGEVHSLRQTLFLEAQWGQGHLILHGCGGKTVMGEDIRHQVVWNAYDSTLRDSRFLRDGWAFAGWSTTPDGKGPWYPVGMAVKGLGICHLYAQWVQAPRGSIRLCANGSPVFGGQSYRYLPPPADGQITLPRQEGGSWQLLGWSRKPCGRSAETLLAPGTTVLGTAAPDRTFYACWTDCRLLEREDGLGILYDSNGGKTRGGGQLAWDSRLSYGSWGNLTLYGRTVVEREGFAFTGWNTAPDGSGTAWEAGTAVDWTTENRLVRLYAQWQALPEPCLLLEGGGARTAEGAAWVPWPVTWGEVCTIPGPEAFRTPDGAAFLGWQDGRGQWYLPGESCSFSGQVTLEARWGRGRMILNGCGGETLQGREIQEQILETGGSPYLQDCPFRMEGYRFLGWNDAPDGSGQWYPAGMTVEQLGICRLYAQWVPDPGEAVCLHANGSRIFGGRTCRYVQPEAELPGQEEGADWQLLGWTGEPHGQDEVWQARDLRTPGMEAGGKPRYACWLAPDWTEQADGAMVLYDPNGGETTEGGGLAADYRRDYSSWGSLTLYEGPEVRWEGCSFLGWNRTPDGTGEACTAGDTLELAPGPGRVLRLYAQWKEDPNAVHRCTFGGTPEPGVLLRVALYDRGGKMLALTAPHTEDGTIWAEFPVRLYRRVKTAKLFRLDPETWVPVAPAAKPLP